MYVKSVSGRDVLRNLLRLLLVGVVIATGIFFGLRQVALQGVVVAERQLAQQDEEAREAAWGQIKTYESEFATLEQAYTAAESAREREEVKKKQHNIARLYKRLWKQESRWGNPRLCGEFPVLMQLQTKP
jgi:nucleoside phosphorylase